MRVDAIESVHAVHSESCMLFGDCTGFRTAILMSLCPCGCYAKKRPQSSRLLLSNFDIYGNVNISDFSRYKYFFVDIIPHRRDHGSKTLVAHHVTLIADLFDQSSNIIPIKRFFNHLDHCHAINSLVSNKQTLRVRQREEAPAIRRHIPFCLSWRRLQCLTLSLIIYSGLHCMSILLQ